MSTTRRAEEAEAYLEKHYTGRGPTERIRLCTAYLHALKGPTVQALVSALEFYANEGNWFDGNNSSATDYDNGDRARDTLKRFREGVSGE
jgi:hypothetical protein